MIKLRSFLSLFFICSLIFFSASSLGSQSSDKPLLAIGASLINGKIPFNSDDLTSPLFGASTNAGVFLDLGSAITFKRQTVINEAEAGATTFKRNGCNPACGPGVWVSYETQFQRALSRVFNPVTQTYNADYLIIGLPNDCLHSDAFGVPQDQATPCSVDDMHMTVSRMISVGNQALELGITPVYTMYPNYSKWDLPSLTSIGILWAINESDFNLLRSIHATRIIDEIPAAIVVDAWRGNYTRIPGDAIHPEPRTSLRAARRILYHINH